jgi:aminoglycoside/choline kinase family phosphotransferase
MFFRWRGGRRSAVLMVFPQIRSAEMAATLRIHRLLLGLRLPLPRLIRPRARRGVLAFQDLGDTTLQVWIRRLGSAQATRWLEAGLRLIRGVQSVTGRRLRSIYPSHHRRLAPQRFRFELDFFRRHYVNGLLGLRPPAAVSRRMNRCFDVLCSQLAGQPQVFCHRDLMSRNLVIFRNRLWMLDYQDAQWGPYSYDLASLLFDSSAAMPSKAGAILAGHYLEAWNRRLPGCRRGGEQFLIDLHRAGLQRNLKELGTFASQAILWGRRGYLRYVPRALRSINLHVRKLPEGAGLASVLQSLGVSEKRQERL